MAPEIGLEPATLRSTGQAKTPEIVDRTDPKPPPAISGCSISFVTFVHRASLREFLRGDSATADVVKGYFVDAAEETG
jgi:hypothetical protein